METRSGFVSFRGNLNSRISPLCVSVSCVSFILRAFSILSLSRYSNALQVIGGNMTVVQGETVILPCKLRDTTESLSQISWQRKTREKIQTDNFLTIQSSNQPQFVNGPDNRFEFIGNFNEKNGSLRLSNVRLLDEGVYTCIFTLFPSGNDKADIPLNVLVPPVSGVTGNLPVLGDEEVSLATCRAAGSRPPAEVKWLLGTLADKVKATTNFTEHANGTTTTDSSLLGVPTKEINHNEVQCVVTSPALSEPQTIPFTVEVYFLPGEVNITLTSKDTFQCVTDANPNATFTWTRSGQSWPQSAVIDGATVQFLRTSSDLNGLYQCEASNSYGRNHAHLYVHVTPGSCTVCWTLLVLLLIAAAVAAAAVWYLYKSGRFLRREENAGGDSQGNQRGDTRAEERLMEVEEVEKKCSVFNLWSLISLKGTGLTSMEATRSSTTRLQVTASL